MSVAVGLVAVLLASGLIEALVTPSPLPTFLRIAIGVAAEVAFLAYVIHFGARPSAPARRATSTTRRIWCRRVSSPRWRGTESSQLAAGLHRQIAVGQRRGKFVGHRVHDVDTVTP